MRHFFLGLLLLAQFEGALLVIALMLASLCVKEYRAIWSARQSYAALIIPMLLLLPFLLWEFQRNFITFHFLHSSNLDNTGIFVFLNALLDYLGSVGLFLVLVIMVGIRYFKNKQMNPDAQFLFFAWVFTSLLLNYVFMDNQIRHITLINSNILLFLFLVVTCYPIYPKLTKILVSLSLLITVTYLTLSLIVSYSNNYLVKVPQLMEPYLEQNTLIIANLNPYDGAPSYLSMHLPGQPPVLALQEQTFNINSKNNPAVYMWQTPLIKLLSDHNWQHLVFISDTVQLPLLFKDHVICQAPKILLVNMEGYSSIQQLLKQQIQKSQISLYLYQCIKG